MSNDEYWAAAAREAEAEKLAEGTMEHINALKEAWLDSEGKDLKVEAELIRNLNRMNYDVDEYFDKMHRELTEPHGPRCQCEDCLLERAREKLALHLEEEAESEEAYLAKTGRQP